MAVFLPEELAGLYVAISRAAQINKPTTFQLTPIFLDTKSTVSKSGVHYEWIFGDEVCTKTGFVNEDYVVVTNN